MNEKISDIVNRDEWDTDCPAKCGNNVIGIIIVVGHKIGFCSKCNHWYNLKTGEIYSNPITLEKDRPNDNEEIICYDQEYAFENAEGTITCSITDETWNESEDAEHCSSCKHIGDYVPDVGELTLSTIIINSIEDHDNLYLHFQVDQNGFLDIDWFLS